MLKHYLKEGIKDKVDFYDHYIFNKYPNRRGGHQFTLEFLITWIAFYQNCLEIRLIHLLSLSPDFEDALKFFFRARKVATEILLIDSNTNQSCDKIFLDRGQVV